MNLRNLLSAGMVLAATTAALSSASAQPKPTEFIPHEVTEFLAGRAYRVDATFPDMAIAGLSFNFPVTAPYTATVTFSVIAKNTGGIAFDHKKAFLVFYDGKNVLAKLPIGKVEPGGVVGLKHTTGVSFPPPSGGKFSADYIARIEYDPYTKALSKKHIDENFANNEKSISPVKIANEIEIEFRIGYRGSLLKLINQYRASKGKAALKANASLASGAQKHSEWMDATNKFQHTQTAIPENIYEGSSDPKACLNNWKNSPGHNTTMLGPYKEIGIGQKGGSITARFQ